MKIRFIYFLLLFFFLNPSSHFTLTKILEEMTNILLIGLDYISFFFILTFSLSNINIMNIFIYKL